MIRFLAPGAFARLRLVSNASYSASLFVAVNYNLTAYLSVSPSGGIRTTPTPPTFFVADPSIWTVHISMGVSSSLQG